LRVALAAAIAVGVAVGVAGFWAPGEAVADPAAQASIVGGGKADPGDWTFAVGLREKGVGLFCTGSLVAPDRVLTAAHCMKRAKLRKLRVIAGSPWVSGGLAGESIRVRRIRIDPDYKGRLDRRDVAVLTLARPSSAKPIALPSARESAAATKAGKRVRSAGWGARSPWGFRLSKRLKATSERTYPNRVCQRYYGKAGFDSRSMICVLGAPIPRLQSRFRLRTTSCLGDSGGPLVASTPAGQRLIGVVSAGPLPCGLGPSIYARVAAELRFIRRAVGPTTP
jgi:trypsin